MPIQLNPNPRRWARACRILDRATNARARGGLDRAQSLGRQALAILESVLGPNHPDVANVLFHLAVTSEDQSDAAKAEPLYRRAVRIMESIRARDPDLDRLRVSCGRGLESLRTGLWQEPLRTGGDL